MKKIAITGHRHLRKPDAAAKQIELSLRYFIQRYTQVQAISTMAAGSDTLFAELALQKGLPLQVILPFPKEEYRKDFSPADWQRVEAVLAHPGCMTVTQKPDPPANSAERKAAYLDTGRQLVEEADILLAVWDGHPPKGKGGTADVVDIARNSGTEVHIIKAMRLPESGETARHDVLYNDFRKADDAAKLYKQRCFMPAWVAGIITGVLAAISFSAGIAIRLGEEPGSHQWHRVKFLLGVAEVVFSIASLFLLLVTARRAKDKFLTNRRRAEYLRGLLWFRNAGIPVHASPPGSGMQEAAPLPAAYHLLPAGSGVSNIPHAARMTWVLATQQTEYHEEYRIAPFRRRLRRATVSLLAIRVIFILIVLFNFALEIWEYKSGHLPGAWQALQPWLVLGWMSMPPVYAAIEGIKHFSEWGKHIAKSEKMKKEFARISKEVMNSTDHYLITARAAELYDVMSLENTDWSEWWKDQHPQMGL